MVELERAIQKLDGGSAEDEGIMLFELWKVCADQGCEGGGCTAGVLLRPTQTPRASHPPYIPHTIRCLAQMICK